MTTIVTFKPYGVTVGDSEYTKTGAATATLCLNDNSDATFCKRITTTVGAYLRIKYDASLAPAGKNLNRWKFRLRHTRPTVDSNIYVRMSQCRDNGAFSRGDYGAPLSGVGVLAGPAWLEGGYNPGTEDFIAGSDLVYYIPTIFLWDGGKNSASRCTIHECWVEADYVDPPTASVSGPTGTITDTNYPTITWAFTSTESNPQVEAVVKVFDAATYGAAGFSAFTSTPVWATTVVGAVNSVTMGTPLPNGGTYRAYVLVKEATGYITSVAVAYAFSTFTLSISPPPLLTVTAGYSQATNSVTLIGQGHANLCSTNQASIETDTTGFVTAGTNCTGSRSTTVGGKVGSAAFRLSSTAGGDMSTTTSVGTAGMPVDENVVYTALASFRAGATARTCRVDIVWYDSGGSVLSTTVGTSLADATGAWTTDVATVATSPANARFAAIKMVVLATGGASELHYVDTLALYPGVSSSSVNLALNPSCEVDTSYMAAFFAKPLTVSRTTVRSTHGAAAFRLTASGTDGANAATYRMPNLTSGVQYVAGVDVYNSTASGVSGVQLYATGTATFYIPNTVGSTSIKDAWTRIYTVFTPVDADGGYLLFGLGATTAGMFFDVDSIQVEASPTGTPTAFTVPTVAWTVGGYSAPTITLERSNDGGTTWLPVRSQAGPAITMATQKLSVTDYEAARPGAVLYRGRAGGTLSLTTTASDYTASTTCTTTSDGLTWLKAVAAGQYPLNTALTTDRGSSQTSVSEAAGIFRPLGRDGEAVVVSGDRTGRDGSITLVATTVAQYEKLLALAEYKGTLLLQEAVLDSAGRGVQRWVRFTGERNVRPLRGGAWYLPVTFVDQGAGG